MKKLLLLCIALGIWAQSLYADLPWRETRQIEKGFTRHRVIDNPGNYKLINWGGRDYGTKSFMPYVRNAGHSHSSGRYWGNGYYPTAACPVPGSTVVNQNVEEEETDQEELQEKLEDLTERVEELEEAQLE